MFGRAFFSSLYIYFFPFRKQIIFFGGFDNIKNLLFSNNKDHITETQHYIPCIIHV
jgi:hypothetical protein